MSETEVIEGTKEIQEHKPGFWEMLLGRLLSGAFWAEVLRAAVTEMFIAAAGRIMWYGESRRDKRMADLMSREANSQVTQKAFGGSYSPTPTYQGSTYPVPTQPQGDVRFPGFGGSR